MSEYIFLTGEVFQVAAKDEAHAKRIIDAYFSTEWETYADVSEEDINNVVYVGADTRYIGQVDAGRMPYYSIYEDYGDTGPDEPFWVTPGTPFQ